MQIHPEQSDENHRSGPAGASGKTENDSAPESATVGTDHQQSHGGEVASQQADEEVPPPEEVIRAGSPAPYPFWGWSDAFLFLGVMLVLLVVMVLIASSLHMMGFIGMAPAAIIAQGVAMGLALLGLSQLFRMRYGTRLRDALHLNAPRGVLRFVFLGLATAMMVAILGAVLKLSEMDMPMKDLIRTDFDLLMVGIGAVTFGPLFEELVFRGFLQPLFARLLGAVPGIIATSLLFAIPHGPQYGWHWQHLMVITAAGAVFGFIRWKTASTTASTIAHSAYNALLVVVAFLQRAYMLGN